MQDPAIAKANAKFIRRQKKLRKKEDIVICARLLFSERGYDDVSIKDIAERLGVSVGYIYTYYGSKKAIFLSCVEGHDMLDLFVGQATPEVL